MEIKTLRFLFVPIHEAVGLLKGVSLLNEL